MAALRVVVTTERRGEEEKKMGLKHADEEPMCCGEYDAEAFNKIINQ